MSSYVGEKYKQRQTQVTVSQLFILCVAADIRNTPKILSHYVIVRLHFQTQADT